jgi:hypothetical protein
MDRYVFLDIDGVVATFRMANKIRWDLNPICQNYLGKIIEETGAKLVITSSWRMKNVEKTKELLEQKGFRYCSSIVGVTIRAKNFLKPDSRLTIPMPQGIEVKHYINELVRFQSTPFREFELGVDYNYVILDDNDDMLLEQANHFVCIDCITGLTEQTAQMAIEILMKK